MVGNASRTRDAWRRHGVALVLASTLTACSGAAGSTSTPTATDKAAPTEAEQTVAPLMQLDVQAKIPVVGAFDITEAFGSLWVAGNDEGNVTRIDPATNQVVATIQVSTFVSAPAATTDGVWVIDGDSQSVRRIDPVTNQLTKDAIVIGDDGGSLQAVGDVLWQSGRATARRIDVKTGKVETFPLTTCGDCGITILDGVPYTMEDGHLARLDPATLKVVATQDSGLSGGLVGLGASGIWTGSAAGGVARLDPETMAVQQTWVFASAAANGSTWALGSAGGNGAIVADAGGAWFRFSGPTIGHVVVADNRADLYGPFPVDPFGASAFVVADGAIWLTNPGGGVGSDETGSVWRLALPTP